MKKSAIALFCLLFFPVSVIKAQDTLVRFDTIHLVQTNYYQSEFSLEDTIINNIRIQTKTETQVKNVHNNPGGNIIAGALTLATGIGFSSSKDVDWYLASSIQTNNSSLDWLVDMYCPGYVEKERTRIKNDDGSYSVETNYVNKFSWNKGAIGFIIESGDTIAWYYVYQSPRTDSTLRKWTNSVYGITNEHPGHNYMEYALLGEFSGNESSLFYNSDNNRIYVFTGTELLCMFQCQKPPPQSLFKKKRE